MRLLHVYAGPFPSHQGTQVYLRGLLGALAARGHRVALRCWGGGEGDEPAGVELRRLPAGRGEALRSGPHPVRIPQAARLAAALRRDLREPWDVVHAHHTEATLIAAALGARPLLHHAHTALAEELPTYGGGALAAVAGDALDRLLATACDGAVALSERGAERLRALGARRVLAVRPGVDLAELSGDGERFRREHRLGGEGWVLYTGNLDAYQDIDVLVGAVAAGGLRLLVVTGSPTGELEEALGAAGVPLERSRLVRSTDFADTRDAMAAAAVGVVPRGICAGFPMKLLNLLGAGLPTVVVEGATDPVAGTVPVPPADPQAMAAALRDLLADPDRRARLGAAGRAAVAAESSWEAHAAAIEVEAVAVRGSVTPLRPGS